MRSIIRFLLACGAIVLASSQLQAQANTSGFVNTLMPQPAHLTAGQGNFELSSSLVVSAPQFRDARLDDAIERMLHRLEYQIGVPVKKDIHSSSNGTSLIIDVQSAGDAIQTVKEDESYTLNVTANSIHLKAATVVGALRGMETILQLVQPAGKGYILPAVNIQDSPRFMWRGLHIDVARHFEPIESIKRHIDAMASVKLNVFHWHLSDDQGFRIESKIYPKLTGMGSDGLFYTQEQAKDVVAYARARGIRVVPEFDMPGHTTSWFVGYPEISSGSGPYEIRREFGVSDLAMDPTRESTYEFIDQFVGEMVTIFPDAYFHVGGDETTGVQWKENPTIVAFMKAHSMKDTAALQTYFSQRVMKIVEKHDRHMVGWDEVLTPDLPKDVVIQSWRGAASLAVAAKQGNQAFLSSPYYLDGMKTAEESYLADPLPENSDLTVEQRKLILGGELCMWAEQINAHTIDSRVWPRTAVVAERFWSPANLRDVEDMYRRLNAETIRLEAFSLTHLTQRDVDLRTLAGTEDIDALRVFASVIEPVPFGRRRTTQFTVLNHLVDAVRPDPPSKHQMGALVKAVLRNSSQHPEEQKQLKQIFAEWQAAAPKARWQVAASPILAEDATVRVKQFEQLAKIGSEAVAYISGGAAPAGWKQKSIAELDAAEKPSGLVRFTFLKPLRQLVEAAAR